MKRERCLIITLCLLIAAAAHAKVELPEIIGDNMVLQQNTQVKIWGKAKANATVTAQVSWSSQTFSAQSDPAGKWIMKLQTPPASFDPQTIELSDGEAITLNNILIGEIWFCSGQSNMEMPLNGFWNNPIEGANEDIAQANSYKGLRFVNIEHAEALTPQETCKGKWMTSTPENLQWCSATAFHFARTVAQAMDVPIGILHCSWGGSRVEGWLPESLLKTYPDIDIKKEMEHHHVWMRPMVMYNAMLKPLQNYTIKGFLWYQGESNVGKHDTYAQRLAQMVELWRKEWGLGELPFYFVEIAPYSHYGEGDYGALLRESQFKAQALIPSSALVSTNDLVEPYEASNIHPKNKTTVGKRLGYLALANTYQVRGIADRGPAYQSMEIKEGKAILTFDNANDGFNRMDGIEGFEMAGADKVFHPAKATVTGERKVIVECEKVAQPVAVRYAFRNFLIGNLENTRGFPAYPFRTDDW